MHAIRIQMPQWDGSAKSCTARIGLFARLSWPQLSQSHQSAYLDRITRQQSVLGLLTVQAIGATRLGVSTLLLGNANTTGYYTGTNHLYYLN